MRTLLRQTFIDEHIDLTGCDVDQCEFNGCVLEVWKGKPTRLADSRFHDCQIQGDGWPQELIDRSLKAGDGRFTFSS